VEQGEKLSRVLLHSIGILSFGINLERETFDEMFMLMWRELLSGGILTFILVGLHERHVVQRGMRAPA
jgi:hypothetical protein